MNSGKYLYKVSAEKKVQITKKVNVSNNYENVWFIFYFLETSIEIYHRWNNKSFQKVHF
jgi:hypothetical protein